MNGTFQNLCLSGRCFVRLLPEFWKVSALVYFLKKATVRSTFSEFVPRLLLPRGLCRQLLRNLLKTLAIGLPLGPAYGAT